MAKYAVEERLEWGPWVTPKPLAGKPIHRWYVFPHSFTSDLVYALIAEWGLGPSDRILDPFVGAGTTLLAAKEKGIPASGYDLSPLAVLTARAKSRSYNLSRLTKAWRELEPKLDAGRPNGTPREYPELVQMALPGGLLPAFDSVARRIASLPYSNPEKEFFQLALLRSLPKYSRAIATGGWLKWVTKRSNARSLPSTITAMVEAMLADLEGSWLPRAANWRVSRADARRLPDRASTYSAVITSPPYPNRHDYTRVFGVELMFSFLDWEQTLRLRYQSFHSHPEAHPDRPKANGYREPRSLTAAVVKIRGRTSEPRVPQMLEGFFLDTYLCLREVERVCKSGAKIAFVVGNAQYCGQAILVDELTARIGEEAGLKCEKLVVARYRGNSAQQMGRYGRRPARESVVIFRKP